jgi:hypothetical protein
MYQSWCYFYLFVCAQPPVTRKTGACGRTRTEAQSALKSVGLGAAGSGYDGQLIRIVVVKVWQAPIMTSIAPARTKFAKDQPAFFAADRL